jgi:CDP-paratose 2-epimerase
MLAMRILITGGAGFIGSSLGLALKARHPDWDLVALDNLHRRGSELNLPRLQEGGVEFVNGDVRQPGDLEAVGAFDSLVECSAEPSVMAEADVIVPVNVMGAYNCFEAAKRHGAQVVFLSTSRVYPIAALDGLAFVEGETRFELAGEQAVVGASAEGIAEDFPLSGRRTMYGASKLCGELLLTEYKLPWVINRCGVVAGPWQMGKVDQGVFAHWALSAYFDRPLSFIGFGGTGKQVRDVLHVADLVDLIERQLLDASHWAGRTYNVGGGREGSLSLLEATLVCSKITDREIEVGTVSETRAGDVRSYISDCRALFEHTDWRPARTPETVMRDIFGWIADHEDLVRETL